MKRAPAALIAPLAAVTVAAPLAAWVESRLSFDLVHVEGPVGGLVLAWIVVAYVTAAIVGIPVWLLAASMVKTTRAAVIAASLMATLAGNGVFALVAFAISPAERLMLGGLGLVFFGALFTGYALLRRRA